MTLKITDNQYGRRLP